MTSTLTARQSQVLSLIRDYLAEAGGVEHVTAEKVREAVRRRQQDTEEDPPAPPKRPEPKRSCIDDLKVALRRVKDKWPDTDAAVFRCFVNTALEELSL